MTLLEQIQRRLSDLPPEKQSEVLDFVTFLQQRPEAVRSTRQRTLRRHPAFGSWRDRKIDALDYQQSQRAEWDRHA
jgi:hypothetical protein